MGKIEIGESREERKSANTELEYRQDTTDHRVKSAVEKIAEAVRGVDGIKCFVVGLGSQPVSVYRELKRFKGVKVHWHKSILPSPYRQLFFFVASQAGLVEILDTDRIPCIFDKLVTCSMAGIYVFSERYANIFLTNVETDIATGKYDFGIKDDPAYFRYLVDDDNFESTSGIVESYSYGFDAMEPLKAVGKNSPVT